MTDRERERESNDGAIEIFRMIQRENERYGKESQTQRRMVILDNKFIPIDYYHFTIDDITFFYCHSYFPTISHHPFQSLSLSPTLSILNICTHFCPLSLYTFTYPPSSLPFLSSFLTFLLPSFLPSFLLSFLLSLLLSFLPSFLPSFLLSFLLSLLLSFLPFFLPSFLPSFLTYLLTPSLPRLLASFIPSPFDAQP